VLDSRETDVAAYVLREGLTVSQAYECSSDGQALVVLSHAVKAAGTLVGVALGWSPAAFDTHSFVAKGQRLFGSCAYDAVDFQHALDLIASGAVNVAPLITEQVPLASAPEAFVRLRKPGSLVAVLVEPWR
jgi:threonine dehydrogenase-like Zn-dependent dehydrogenase